MVGNRLGMEVTMTGIPLSDVLAELRSEIKKAHADGQGQEFRFALEEIDVELQVAVTTEMKGGVKVKFLVVDSEAGGGLSRHCLQKIHVKMKPLHAEPKVPVDLASITLKPSVVLATDLAKMNEMVAHMAKKP